MTKSKPSVIILPLARNDMEDIFEYIKADNPDAARDLLRECHEKIAALPEHPKLYKTGRMSGTREMLIRSNYVVVYKENSQNITVLRLFHAARKWG